MAGDWERIQGVYHERLSLVLNPWVSPFWPHLETALDRTGSVLTQQRQSYVFMFSVPNERDKLSLVTHMGHYSPIVLMSKDKCFEKFENTDF